MRRLLVFDCCAGASAGVLMLALRGWLAPWYGLPEALLVFMGIVNLGYAAFGGVLVLRGDPRPRLAPVLIVANFVWAAACVCGAAALAGTATVFGLAHLALEGLFVGSLAAIERRRWRALRAPEDSGASQPRRSTG